MSETYLACLTPAGVGAIATLAVRGPLAWMLVREFAERELPLVPSSGRFWLTRLGDMARGEADEVVVAVKQLTPEPCLELHCHGGREVVRMLEELFNARGVRVLDWSEFERIGTNPLQNAALSVLANALTVRTATIALDQYQDALARAIDAIRKAIEAGDASGAARFLAEIDRYSGVGLHLNMPWLVAVAGAPNVGKSSLVNALAGYQRSVVSPTPGTTRDVVTTLLALDGWAVEVSDTAGWREAETPLEREGITRAGEAIASADLTLWVLDGAASPIWPPANLGTFRYVINKVDLPAAWPHDTVEAVHVSAHTGEGLAALCEAITNWLVPEGPPAGAAVAFTAKLAAGLKSARELMKDGRSLEALAKLESLCRECD